MNAPAVFPRIEPGSRHRFTVEDVWRMVEAGVIAPDASLEILDGEIIDIPSERELHLTFKSQLVRALNLGLGPEWRVVPDGTLHLSPADAPEPDAYVLPADAALRPVDPAAVPLVIEIADSSLAYDSGRKAAKYAEYGLAEYWIVDVNARLTHVLSAPADGAFGISRQVAFAEPLTAGVLPGLTLLFDDLVPPEA